MVAKIHKTRLTSIEREALFGCIADCARQVKASPPSRLIGLKPVYLTYVNDADEPSISFQPQSSPIPSFAKVVALEPEGLLDFLATRPEPAELPPEAFKLYMRSDGQITYHEAWPTEAAIVEHWGVCGERGDICEYPTNGANDQRRKLATLKSKAKAMGYKSIPLSKHVSMLVERQIEGFGSGDDIDERHALQELLDQQLGWLGLGHCDGGSSGSGSMEAFCLVVDYKIASVALTKALADSRFNAFKVRRGQV